MSPQVNDNVTLGGTEPRLGGGTHPAEPGKDGRRRGRLGLRVVHLPAL